MKYTIITQIIIISCIIFLEATEYSYLATNPPGKSYQYQSYLLSYFTSILLLCIIMFFVLGDDHYAQKKLINLNKILYYKNQHLKKINNELDSFVYKTPHDLRAPLASMLGLINIAKNESNVDEIKKYIELQERSVKKLDSYIADILEITKNSNQDISYENINLSQLVEESLQQLVYFHDSHKIKISTFINEQEKLYSDRYRLQIILQNLLSNSIRYIDENKTTCIIEIHADVQQYIFILKIVDNGIGIQKDHLDKIFDIFYRASEKSKGSGLGLYIVLYIVKENIARLGGNITVDSEYGKGTTFTITLPNHTLLKNI